jgi:hypothetical protein
MAPGGYVAMNWVLKFSAFSLCVLWTTIAPAQTNYVVAGTRLGQEFVPSTHQDYRCDPSELYANFQWCRRRLQEPAAAGSPPFTSTNTLLYSSDGIAYLGRQVYPAYFTQVEVEAEIARLSNRRDPRLP